MSTRSILILLTLLPMFALTQGKGNDDPPPADPPAHPPASQPDDDKDSEKDKTKYEKLTIGETEFKLEYAATPRTRAKGLMGREKLKEKHGMIFIYPRASLHDFWMKNCLMDIDIIFLSSSGRVTAQHEMKKEDPQGDDESLSHYEDRLKRYSSRRSAQYAIELEKGQLKKLKLKLGDRIKLDLRKLRKLAR